MRPRVQVYTHCSDASSFYRLTEPARVLGVEVVERPEEIDAQTVITNRPILPEVSEWVCRWAAEGKRVIVDNDDDFDTLSPDHGAYGRFLGEHIHRACKAATLNTVSTPALARRYGYGKVRILPNCVPESYLKVAPRGRRDPISWVGWSGSISAHPHDLKTVGQGLRDAVKGRVAQTVYLGPKYDHPVIKEQLQLDDRLIALGLVSLYGFPTVISEFTVGIVPLQPGPFNEAKSWLKGLELAAVGVPVIASPTSDYRRLHSLGGCLIASTPAEWRKHIGELLENREYRHKQSAAGREVARRWTYERRAHEWRSVWLG